MNENCNAKDTEQTELLFFTCATGYYENFVIPYIYFAELSNPSSKFEFIVSNAESFIEKNKQSLTWLEKNLRINPVIRDLNSASIKKPKIDNTIRFIVEPMQKSKYVYIGDVDIMILENILSWHKPIFDAGLPYSNIVRLNTKRLSGLHLTKYEEYYPLPIIDDIVEQNVNDEEILYKIVERKGNLYDTSQYNALVKGRPLHGIHMSLNRLPFSAHDARVSWCISYSNAEFFEKITHNQSFEEFFNSLSNGSKQIIVNLIYLSRGICFFGEEYFNKIVHY